MKIQTEALPNNSH